MSYIKNADIQGNAWVAPGACVVGNVTLGDESSVWYNAVLRGDMAPIVVGCGSNVQDGTVVHADNGFPCKIGNGTSIVTQGTVIPDGMLAFGSPAKVIRPLTDAEKKENQTNGISYMLMKNVQKV